MSSLKVWKGEYSTPEYGYDKFFEGIDFNLHTEGYGCEKAKEPADYAVPDYGGDECTAVLYGCDNFKG